jgi:general secretion pathway protein I
VSRRRSRGFTLVEVLVALVVIALGLSALMVAVSGAARTSGYLRDKTLAQWIALNRITEVRLTVNRLGQTNDTGEVDYANRTWHYDTRYYDTSIPSMKRVVVRVWPGDAKTKGNPMAESTGFLGASLTTPGGSNIDWTAGTSVTANPCPAAGTNAGPGNGANLTNTGPLGPTGTNNTNCLPNGAQSIPPATPPTPPGGGQTP